MTFETYDRCSNCDVCLDDCPYSYVSLRMLTDTGVELELWS